MIIHRGQSEGNQTLRGNDQSHNQSGGKAWLLGISQSHGQTGGEAVLYNAAQSHNQSGGEAVLLDNAQSHSMRGGTLYVRSPAAKVIDHRGGTVIWQKWHLSKYVETRREVKPDIKPGQGEPMKKPSKKPAKKPTTLPIKIQFRNPHISVSHGPPGKYYGKCEWGGWMTWGDDDQIVERATIAIITRKSFTSITAARALARRRPVVVAEKPNA